jgi:DNA polymerase delta subunit 1
MSNNKMTSRERTVVFKALYWNAEEVENKIQIHIGGIQQDNKTVHVIVEDFTPFVYVELPKRVTWTKKKIETFVNYLKNTMKENGPKSYFVCSKRKLHCNIEANCICLMFPNHKATSFLAKRCHESKGLFIEDLGAFKPMEFLVHEQMIDPIVKLTATKNLQLASWLSVKEKIHPEDLDEYGEPLHEDERKFSSADIDLYCNWNDISTHDFGKVVPTYPKYMSFDLECYSKNHNSKIPDPTLPENFIFSLAYVCGRFGKPNEPQKKVLLTLFDPHDIDDVEVIRCRDEKELLIKWTALIRSEDPDIFLSYNGMKFDWNYIITRAEILGIYPYVAEFSRIHRQKAELKTVSWSSSAYGDQEFRYFEARGRTNIDVILEVERNYRLPKYTLEYVSTHFLKEHKDDVSHRQLFILVQFTQELLPKLEADIANATSAASGVNTVTGASGVSAISKLSEERKKYYHQECKRIMSSRFCTGEVKELRSKFLQATSLHEMKKIVREALTITGRYNVQDCILPIRLADKLKLLISMEETSNITNVPISYLHTRGQGIKVLSQIYRSTITRDIIIPYHPRTSKDDYEKYQGAIVQEAHPGYYTNVACLDFSSLYPSCMIALNICYTTFVHPNDTMTPDEDCNVLEFEDHIGCEHDPQKRKKKAADVLCKKHRYRFRKMKLLEDGTRVGEGIMPMIERNLLANRKIVKKEMEKLECIYKVASGNADDEDIEDFRKAGIDIEAALALTQEEKDVMKTTIAVLDAKQLAIKVAANSCYGILGSQGGHIPLVEGAASVTATGRNLITKANEFIVANFSPAKVIYGDTDSTMVKFGDENVLDSYNLGDKASRETSHFLKCYMLNSSFNFDVNGHERTVFDPYTSKDYRLDKFPRKKESMNALDPETRILIHSYDALPIKLEFENLYGQYFLLTKKRYVARVFNREGKITKETKKGIVLARRDNSQFLRDSYKKLIDSVMENKSEDEIKYAVYERVNSLFTRQIPDSHFIIYIGISTVINYAKKKEIQRAGDTVKVYIDEEGKPFEPTGPLDPRLVYMNRPQVSLSLKLLRRGDEVPANTRLEFLYIENKEAEHQGDKAEDYTYFKEYKLLKNLKPDLLHYVEKQLSSPVTELLNVKCPGEIVPYIPLEQHFAFLIRELNELQLSRVLRCKTFIREAPEGEIFRDYTFTKFDAQYNYILQSMRDFYRSSEGSQTEIDPMKHSKLKQVCLQLKSKKILDDLCTRFGCKKRVLRKPPGTSEKLRLKTDARGETQVVFIDSPENKVRDEERISSLHLATPGTIGVLKEIYEVDKPNALVLKKKDKKVDYFYDVYIPSTGVTLERVHRDAFTTFTLRDSNMMDEIYKARENYYAVIDELLTIVYS